MADDLPAAASTSPMATRYDIRVRTLLGPAVRCYLAPDGEHITITEGSECRFQFAGNLDLVTLYERLADGNVDVISIRRLG